MPTFQWEGKTRDGAARSGVLTAASDQAVISQLKEQNIMATRVKPKAKNVGDYLKFLQPSARRTSWSSRDSSRP
jgi:type II secretory pathway component PulF